MGLLPPLQLPRPLPQAPAETGPLVTAIEIRSDAPLDPARGFRQPDRGRGGGAADRRADPPHAAQPPGERRGGRDRALHAGRSGGGRGRRDHRLPRRRAGGGGPRSPASWGCRRTTCDGRSRREMAAAALRGQGGPGRQRAGDSLRAQRLLPGAGPRRRRNRSDAPPGRRHLPLSSAVRAPPSSTIAFDHPVDPFQPAELVKQLRLKPGDPFSRRIAGEDAERLQSWLIHQGYGQARVDPPHEEIEAKASRDARSETVKLTYPISIGPKIELVVKGADEKKLRKQGLLPFLGESGYDEALVLQAQNRLKTYFQQQGYYDVARRHRRAEDRRQAGAHLRHRHRPGLHAQEIVFTGNQEIPDAKLRPILKTSPPVLLHHGSGRLVQTDLDADLDNLRRLLRPERLRAGRGRSAQGREDGGDLRLVIPIKEGPRERVVKLDFEGVTALDLEAGAQDAAAPGGERVPPRPPRQHARRSARRSTPRWGTPAPRSPPARTGTPITPWWTSPSRCSKGRARWSTAFWCAATSGPASDVIRRTLGLEHGEPVSQAKLFVDRAQPLSPRHLLAGRRGARPRQPRRDRARRADPGRGGEGAQRPLRRRLGLGDRRPRLALLHRQQHLRPRLQPADRPALEPARQALPHPLQPALPRPASSLAHLDRLLRSRRRRPTARTR